MLEKFAIAITLLFLLFNFLLLLLLLHSFHSCKSFAFLFSLLFFHNLSCKSPRICLITFLTLFFCSYLDSYHNLFICECCVWCVHCASVDCCVCVCIHNCTMLNSRLCVIARMFIFIPATSSSSSQLVS